MVKYEVKLVQQIVINLTNDDTCNIDCILHAMFALNTIQVHSTRINLGLYKLFQTPCGVVLVSIVVSIPACHAGDRGSIPRRGEFFLLFQISTFF